MESTRLARRFPRFDHMPPKPAKPVKRRRLYDPQNSEPEICPFCGQSVHQHSAYNIRANWQPTARNINALPEPLRRYIHDLTTRCDPAGDIQMLWLLRDQVDALEAQLAAELKGRRWATKVKSSKGRKASVASSKERLHWGMSASEARLSFPDLVLSPDPFAMVIDQSASPLVAVHSYQYGGCKFELKLSFFRDRLDSALLRSTGPVPACRWDVVNDLNAHYRSAPNLSPPNGVYYENANGSVSGNTTSAGYRYLLGFMYVDFRPLIEVTDRRAQSQLYVRCQAIGFRVEPTGASSPEPIPDTTLACEYPELAVRLQESGTVKLQVHVLTGGSVSDARILVPDKHRRISDAALQLAKTRLRFLPAQQNGMPVESDVVVDMKFEVVHPIHGLP